MVIHSELYRVCFVVGLGALWSVAFFGLLFLTGKKLS